MSCCKIGLLNILKFPLSLGQVFTKYNLIFSRQGAEAQRIFPAGKVFSATLTINYTGKGHFQHSADLAFLFFLIKKEAKRSPATDGKSRLN